MTLTVNFDLYLENFNLGQNFWTVKGMAFVCYMWIPYDKTFQLVLNFWLCDPDCDHWPKDKYIMPEIVAP